MSQPTADEIKTRVRAATDVEPPYVSAVEYIDSLDGASRAVRVRCDDGYEYAIKGVNVEVSSAQRQRRQQEIYIEQVVGRIAALVHAPVPAVAFVHLAHDLIAMTPGLAHLSDGFCHGCQWVPNTEEMKFQGERRYTELETNRERWAVLAVLLGLFHTRITDFQYIRLIDFPHTIYSVDHGVLAGLLPIWGEGEPFRDAQPLKRIVSLLRERASDLMAPDEVIRACATLEHIDDWAIVDAVAMCPRAWGIDTSARIRLARYLVHRRTQVLRWRDDQLAAIDLNHRFRQRGW